MKALSLIQPWASLVAIGAKKIETRSWWTGYRGPLAIHASKGMPPFARGLFYRHDVGGLLWNEERRIAAHPDDLPRGRVVAIARLVECVRIPSAKVDEALGLDARERLLGDYRPGRFAWFLSEPQMISAPARGMLGLWDWRVTLPDEFIFGRAALDISRRILEESAQ